MRELRENKLLRIDLHFGPTRAMNQVPPKGARKGARAAMTKAETNDTAAAVTAQGATVAPQRTASKKATSERQRAPERRKTATGAKPRKQAKPERKSPRKAAAPRAQNKGRKILEMIGRPNGATLSEIMTTTGWQPHSVRGFISTAGKKHDVKIESKRNEAGDRVYRIIKQQSDSDSKPPPTLTIRRRFCFRPQ
jgi:hypothetical protein